MNEKDIIHRIDNLTSDINQLLLKQDGFTSKEIPKSFELLYGTWSIMSLVYGSNSIQVQNFTKDTENIKDRKFATAYQAECAIQLAKGVLNNVKTEIEKGFIGSLQKTITGDVLTDFLQLARAALGEEGDDAKNVAAVLTAALFEDTIRRLATANGIPHIEKLQDVITELKEKGILQGSQVGIANSYLNFRNNSLHAQWDKVERESVASVLGFVEQLLIKHFS